MYKTFILILCGIYLCALPAISGEVKAGPSEEKRDLKKEIPKEETVSTAHSIKVDGKEIPYKATVGTQVLNDENNNPKAMVFYTAYTKENVENQKVRPITFCFNGGPGAASVWLHLGVLGPRRVNIDQEGKMAKQPFHLVDNHYSLLDVTDLVFIDPVSTGYSRAVPGEDLKQFLGVEEDVQSVAEFIRLYVTRHQRWESPKFLAGESYGTTRAAGVALELHDNHYLYLDGIILISCVLNFQTVRFDKGNDLPYPLFLPTFTATALYHGMLSGDLQKDKRKTMEEAQRFAEGEYTAALMAGDRLDPAKRKEVVDKMARYTGLSSDYVDRANLRVSIYRFARELLREENRIVGRFDSRLVGIVGDACGNEFEYDPSFENVVGLFTATFNDYVRSELNWKRDEEYKVMADVISQWNYGIAKNQYLNVAEKLREVMYKNPRLQVYVASGATDMATPYFATEYTFSHMGLDPSLRRHASLFTYEGGHMMYLYYPTLIKMKNDLAKFINNALIQQNIEASPL